MSEVVLHPDPQAFPIGTVVKVYARPAGSDRPISGEPPGSLVTEPTVASAGTLTVTGLTEGSAYIGWSQRTGVDYYLRFAVANVTPEALTISGQQTSTGTKTFTSSSAEGAVVKTSAVNHHALAVKNDGTSGSGSAANFTTANTLASAVQITGKELSKGSLKIAHLNPGPEAESDLNAAALSLDLQNNGMGGTAAQGLFITSTLGPNTGAWVTIRSEAKALLARIKAGGALELVEQAAPPTVEAGCFALYVEAGKLFLKLGAAAAKEITVP